MAEQVERTVLITGAAGGIGRATAACFAREGWTVVGADREPHRAVLQDASFRECDVSSADDVLALFGWIQSQFGCLHALVNNAAIQICKPLVEMDVEEWDLTLESNLRSIFLTAKYGFSLLKPVHGAIVNVSSVHALATSTDIAAYAASKGGILALTRAMALEFARDEVRVNAILPGAVDTQMLREGLERGHVAAGSIEDRLAELGAKTVMGRVGRSEEIAEAILFLADRRRSSFMTGQAMVVDGGATARLSTE